MEVGSDQNVSLVAIDTKSQVLGRQEGKTGRHLARQHHHVGLGGHPRLFRLGVKVSHLINNWGFDENLPRLAQEAAEGAIGISQCPLYGQDVPLMDQVVAYAKKINPSVPQDKRLLRTTQAWANVLLMAEALKRADKAGDLSGEAIVKNGFETMKDWADGPGRHRSADLHRGRSPAPERDQRLPVLQGQVQLLEKVDLKARWPEKWDKEWLGW